MEEETKSYTDGVITLVPPPVLLVACEHYNMIKHGRGGDKVQLFAEGIIFLYLLYKYQSFLAFIETDKTY
jgi:hypothetical protein